MRPQRPAQLYPRLSTTNAHHVVTISRLCVPCYRLIGSACLAYSRRTCEAHRPAIDSSDREAVFINQMPVGPAVARPPGLKFVHRARDTAETVSIVLPTRPASPERSRPHHLVIPGPRLFMALWRPHYSWPAGSSKREHHRLALRSAAHRAIRVFFNWSPIRRHNLQPQRPPSVVPAYLSAPPRWQTYAHVRQEARSICGKSPLAEARISMASFQRLTSISAAPCIAMPGPSPR